METIFLQAPQTSSCHAERYVKNLRPGDLDHAYSAFLAVKGMGCETCATRVYNSLLQLDGVMAVEVDLERALVHVLFNPSRAVVPFLLSAVAAAGTASHHHYTAQLLGVYEQTLE